MKEPGSSKDCKDKPTAACRAAYSSTKEQNIEVAANDVTYLNWDKYPSSTAFIELKVFLWTFNEAKYAWKTTSKAAFTMWNYHELQDKSVMV